MREQMSRARESVVTFIRENAWVPLAARALGIAASMLVLAGIGAGWLDTTFDLGPPRAEAAFPPRAPRARPVAAERPSRPSSTAAPRAAATGLAGPAASPAAPSTPPRVILNTASELELQQLPGVGPARAKAIVALREKLGRFKRFEDLLRVRGIKRRSLERIRERAVLDPPPPEEVPPPAPPTPGAASPGGAAAPSAASLRSPTW